MNKAKLNKILSLHAEWLEDESKGEIADLSGADLRWANLRGADLRRADLSGANLMFANLKGTIK